MAKRRSLTVAWKCICIVTLNTTQKIGIDSCLGLIIGTKLHSNQQSECLHTGLFLVKNSPQLIKNVPTSTDMPLVQQQLKECDEMLEQLKLNLMGAQQRMKAYADAKRKELEFQVGDLVFVKLQPYRQHSVALRRN